jgi:protein disulfide-isomerase-like protein
MNYFFLGLLLVGVNGSYEDQFTDIVVLRSSEFQAKVIETGDPYFVQFMAPWCGHCLRMMATWNQAAVELKGKTFIARVDCTVDPELKDKFRIRGFPTLKLFFNGRVMEFNGMRSKSALMAFIEQHNAYMGNKKEQKKYKLHTHKWRTSGEPIRLLLADLGSKYEAKEYTDHEWEAEKNALKDTGVNLYDGLPILSVGENSEVNIYGTNSILRYLQADNKMNGENEEQYATLDIMFTACDDFMVAYKKLVMVPRDDFQTEQLNKLIKTYLNFFTSALYRAIKMWSSDGYGGFVAGGALSGVDVYMFDIVCLMMGVDSRLLENNPNIRDWFITVGTRDNLNVYMASEKRPVYANSPKAAFGNAQYPDEPSSNPFREM